MARKHSKHGPYVDMDPEEEAPAAPVACWLCERPTGKTIRYGMDVALLLANPNVRKFVDWVAKKDPDFTATTAKKQR
eukprot:gene30000-biopygen19190